MDVVRAAVRVGARHFSFRRVPVDPAILEPAAQHVGVVLAERRHRADHVFLRLLGRVPQIDRCDERRIQVVVVQVVGQPHHPLAQPEIAMERRQMAVHAVDQAHIDRHRDVRDRSATPRGSTRTCATSRRTATSARSSSSSRRSVRLKPPSASKNADIAAWRSARFGRRAQLAVAGLIDFDRLAVGERDRGIREIGVREDRVDVVGRPSQRRRVGQDLLFGIRQRVRRPASDVPQVEGVGRQPRLRRNRLLDRRDSRSSGPPARCTRPGRRSSRRSAASPAACPGHVETRVSSSDSMLA